MPRNVQRISQQNTGEYARFPPQTYSTIQQGLMQVLVERKVGRNGLMVMIALCGAIYADGRLGDRHYGVDGQSKCPRDERASGQEDHHADNTANERGLPAS